ncbi:MAG TPA: hypothetical protein VKQ32_16940, partial [Polyangia bacterium]|nr:hypothetical protein [Polyangia bacterium]
RLRTARRLGGRTIESMFTATSMGGEERVFYAAAWITTHYLMNHRPEAMRRYLKALHDGATPAAAWTAGFGSDTPAQIAGDVQLYLAGGQYAMLVYDMPRPSLPDPVERRLTDADVHATRALLYLTGHRNGALGTRPSDPMDEARLAARRELDEARRQEPGHVVSRAVAHWMFGEAVDLDQATAAREQNGANWLAWLLLAEGYRQHGDGAGFADAITQALDSARADRSVELPVALFKP